jgi:hypothetical protein
MYVFYVGWSITSYVSQKNFELTFRYTGNSLECYLSVWAEFQLKLNVICRGFSYPVHENNETVCLYTVRPSFSKVFYQFHAFEVAQLISSSWDITLHH